MFIFSTSVPGQSLEVTSLNNWSYLTTLKQFAATLVNNGSCLETLFAFKGVATLLTEAVLKCNSSIMTAANNTAKL